MWGTGHDVRDWEESWMNSSLTFTVTNQNLLLKSFKHVLPRVIKWKKPLEQLRTSLSAVVDIRPRCIPDLHLLMSQGSRGQWHWRSNLNAIISCKHLRYNRHGLVTVSVTRVAKSTKKKSLKNPLPKNDIYPKEPDNLLYLVDVWTLQLSAATVR